jgi:tripeptide aminopeptidase
MLSIVQAQTNSDTAAPQQDVARVAALRGVHSAFAWVQRNEREIAERQLELARIPAPPFGEQVRSEWLQQRFRSLELPDVHVDSIGNVFGVRPGANGDAKFIALCAHIDTVFPAGTPLDVRRDGDRLYGPGISDNGAGVSGVLAVISAMQAGEIKTASPIVFIGNVGEEGEGDLRGMRHIFADPQWKDAIAYTVVLDGANADTIVTQALGSRRFEVTVRGPGGHSWSDFGTPNPIVLLARAIDAFSRVAIPTNPRTTFNVGVISGGTSVNSIPESASMRVDIRSSSMDEIDRLEHALREALEKATHGIAIRNSPQKAESGRAHSADAGPRENASVTFDVKLIGSRPAAELPEGARILEVVQAVDAHLQNPSKLQRASTDANVPLSLGREAITIGAGGLGGGAHTVHEWYDPRGRDLGLKRVLLTVLTLAGAE